MRLLLFLLAALAAAPICAQQTWTEVAPMPTPRAYAASAVLNGQVYVIGGRGAGGAVLGVVERYDPASNSWTTVASLRRPRYNAAATVLGGHILLTGGREADGRVTDDVEVYVPAEDDWESFDHLEFERGGHAAFTVGTDAYVFGGAGANGGLRADAEYYDTSQSEWYPYPQWVLASPRAAFAAVSQRGGVLVFGGFSTVGPLSDVEFYVPGQGGMMRASLPEPRGGLAGAGNGNVTWAIGGQDATGSVVSRVDVYDFDANTWTPEVALPAPREGAVAAYVQGGLYVFGGQGGQGFLYTSTLNLALVNAIEGPADALGFALDHAGPNPFGAQTRLALTLDRPQTVAVAVYDVLGRRVARLHDGPLLAGQHAFAWDGHDASGRRLPAGRYLVRATAGARHAALSLTLTG